MPCERCKTKFTLITWKKSCFECHRLFCRNCLSKGQPRSLCQNCIIFTKRPLSRTDLAQLKVRELIFYLQSKHISTSGCVEKDDLINLVIAHVNSGASSPRTPPGSFSTASSPRGSVPSGGSSRNGSFHQDATGRASKNCSNPFDQIKNTCQNLFSNITDKFNGDVSNEGNGGARSPNGRPNGFNIHPEAQQQQQQQQQHIFSQPRFGSNNVYSVDPSESRTGGSGRRGDTANPGSNGNQRESMETGRSPASERTASRSGSSGTTSGADSSAASSSFSSPSRAGGQPLSPLRDPEQSQGNDATRLDDRIESILAREGNTNGCECYSDDEEADETRSPSAGDQEATRKSKLSKRKSVSHTNLLPNSEEAGPSQTANVADNPPPTTMTMHLKPESNSGATTSSSFDELLTAEVGQRSGSPSNHTMAEETIPLVESDTEQWQIVSVSVTNGGDTQELICELPMADVTLTQDGEMSDSSSTTHSDAKPRLGDSPVRTVRPIPAVTRRRSDSFLLHSTPSQAPDAQQHQYRSVGTTAGEDDTIRGPESGIAASTDIADEHGHAGNEAIPSSSHYPAGSSSSGMCLRCGKRRNGIRRQLKKFRRQLESATGASEADKRRQLEAFLSYLERRSKGSFDFTDTDSLTEEASVSEEANDAASRLAPSGELGATSTLPVPRTSTVPPASADETICTNLYSSGNLQLMNMKQIKLTDIKESADLDVLSVKQLKEILMLNRVDFKGCCEKAELRERVLRLWRDDRSIRSIEMLTSDDLCKICMDAPIECVMLECGHMATCTACGKVLSECPICRQYIVRVVRFFRA
uniref:Putative ring finger protein b n=1 Tax=Anopheles triannulatus TaxID=58253 RepID=A0A2M4A8E5_9DIPT